MAAKSMTQDKWHKGEKEMHRRTHFDTRIYDNFVRKSMLQPQRMFFKQLPFFLVGSVSPDDTNALCWASIAWGPPGFVFSSTEACLQFENAYLAQGDPLRENLVIGAYLGGLGIDFAARRRNRANGTVTHVVASPSDALRVSFSMNVTQSYGNCPKYIQARSCSLPATFSPSSVTAPAQSGTIIDNTLSPCDIILIQRSDTMFVASTVTSDENPLAVGSDISHRGGAPGFVVVLADNNSLEWPDYIGNFMFNTLGNLLRNPSCGLLFINFETGDLLQLSGRAEVLHDVYAQPEAQRMVCFTVKEKRFHSAALPLKWAFLESSPFNPLVNNTYAYEMSQNVAIKRIVQETPNIKTFWMSSEGTADEKKKKRVAGQFGTFMLELPLLNGESGTESVVRTWTISSAPSGSVQTNGHSNDEGSFSITVKRKEGGRASTWLFDHAQVGNVLLLKGFSGEFTLKQRDIDERRPLLFFAAGIGITPIASILRSLDANDQLRLLPRVDILFGARSECEMPFLQELSLLAARSPNVFVSLFFSQQAQPSSPASSAAVVQRVRYHYLAHVNALAGLTLLADIDAASHDIPNYRKCAQAFICGPDSFMHEIQLFLTEANIPSSHITLETFNY